MDHRRDRIRRVNMDGTGHTRVLTNVLAWSLSIDYQTGLLFWFNFDHHQVRDFKQNVLILIIGKGEVTGKPSHRIV